MGRPGQRYSYGRATNITQQGRATHFKIFTFVLLQAMHLQSSTGNRYNGEGLSMALFLSTNQLITFLCIRSTSRSITVSITITQDRSITSESRLQIEDGDIGIIGLH